MKRTRFLILLALFTVVLALQVLAAYAVTWTPIYEGVDYAEATKSSPRLMQAFATRVDLWNPYVSFFATPSNGGLPMETNLQTTPAFLSAYGLKAAINANFYVWDSTNTYANNDGLLISNGSVVSTGENRSAQLRITAGNVATILDSFDTPTGIYTAVCGDAYHLINGNPTGDNGATHPRTSVGISQNGRYLIMCVVDGRQPGWSDGATILDMSYWMLDFGAWNALNLDGGGSATMVRDDIGTCNRPCYGYARSVGSNFGVYAYALPPLVNPPYYYDSSIQSWYSGNGVSGIAYAPAPGWPGCMYFDQTGDDGFVYSPRTNFVGQANDSMTVRVYPQSGNSASHDMKLYWRTADEPWWDEAKSCALVSYTAQNAWAVITLDVDNAKWVGKTITQMRLDVDGTNHATRFIVDYVTLSGPPVADIIIDNPQGTCSANWATSTSSTQKYGSDYRWRSTTAISDPFTWTPTIVTPGNYEVYAWWPASSNRSTTAPYIIYYNGGSANVPMNQQINGGQWNSLGTYNFAAGTTGNVKLSCWTTTGFVVCADAVKFVKR